MGVLVWLLVTLILLFLLFRVPKVKHFVIVLVLWGLGRRQRRLFEEEQKNIERARRETLNLILKETADTACGKSLRLRPEMSEEEFAATVPFTTYSHYAGFVDQIVDGSDEKAMSKLALRQIGTTSGTSGSIKKIPMTKKQALLFFMHGVTHAFYTLLTQTSASMWKVQKSCKLMGEPNFSKSASGLKIGPNSSAPSNSGAAMCMYSSPMTVYQLPLNKHGEAMYLHAFYALADNDLGMVEANFASYCLELFVTIEGKFHSLMGDLKVGYAIIDGIKYSLRAPMPRRARTLAQIVEKSGFKGCAPKFWPKMNLVLTCDTGAMELYSKNLRVYIGDEMPVYSPFLGCTEGIVGFNPEVGSKTYSFLWSSLYIEFIDESDADAVHPQTTKWQDLRVGSRYELVLTTWAGLTRYRYGDVVEITQTEPRILFSFSHRVGTICDLKGEKLTEAQMFQALSALSNDIVEYTLIHHLKLQSDDVAVHVFLELSKSGDKAVFGRLDDEIQERNAGYRYHRQETRSIGPVQVHFLAAGAFAEITTFLRESGYPPNQLKIPRVETRPPVIEILQKNRLNY